MNPTQKMQYARQENYHRFHPYQQVFHTQQGPIVVSIPAPQNHGHVSYYQQTSFNHQQAVYGNINNDCQRLPASNAYRKVAEKKKRTRIDFSDYQKSILFREFAKSPYVNQERRKELSAMLNVPEKNIKVWFQNRRMDQKYADKETKEISPKHYTKEIPQQNICNGVADTNLVRPIHGLQSQSSSQVTYKDTILPYLPNYNVNTPPSHAESEVNAPVCEISPATITTEKEIDMERILNELKEFCEQHDGVSSTSSDAVTETASEVTSQEDQSDQSGGNADEDTSFRLSDFINIDYPGM